MLFIGDLHLKLGKKKEIFEKLKNILDNTDEKNIIFLGDYVYHFNYSPQVIDKFLDLVISYTNSKKIYILAGNHDYIKGNFIFSQAEKLTHIGNIANLKIISHPQIENIDNKKVLLFPFYTHFYDEEEFIKTDKKIKKYKGENKNLIINLFFTAYQNFKEDNKNQKISASINLDLVNILLDNQIDLLVHHFYIEGASFPGQFSKFSFKNIALSRELFKADFDIVSGHLHKAFQHKNYTCVGSFWNTSPLEENDTKVVYYYPNKFQQVIINPYISFSINENKITEQDIYKKWNEIEKENKEILQKEIENDKFDIKKVNLVLKSDEIIDFNDVLDSNLKNRVSEIKFRQISNKKISNILSNLEIDKEKLGYSFESWKKLTKDYIEAKYADKKDSLLKLIDEYKILE